MQVYCSHKSQGHCLLVDSVGVDTISRGTLASRLAKGQSSMTRNCFKKRKTYVH